MKVCIVIPAYNEEKRIIHTLNDFEKTIIKKYGNNVEILVVSESTDKTNSIVRTYAFKHKQIRLLRETQRHGKGGALIKGFAIACQSHKWDVVGFVDADPSITGVQVMKLLDRLSSDHNVDGVIASRYSAGSKILGEQKLSRLIASRAYNIFLRILLGFNYVDTQCGAKFFRTNVLRSILPYLALTDMSFDLDLLYQMQVKKYNVVEVPITYNMITEGTKLRMTKQVPQMFIVAIGYRIAKSRFKVLVPSKVKGKIYHYIKKW